MGNSRTLKVGDVCTTINCRPINFGLLVVIIGINRAHRDRRDQAHPYRIRRVDGQPFPCVDSVTNGSLVWYKSLDVWAVAARLKRIDPKADDARDAKVIRRKVPALQDG